MIAHDDFTSIVRRTSDLHILKKLPHSSYAWWEGNRLGHLDTSDGYLFSQGRRHRSHVGRSDLVAASDDGHYFLAVRQTQPGTDANGDTPPQHVELWQSLPRTQFRFVRTLATANFDRFEGDPRHLAILNKNTLVFGLPVGGGAGYDYLCIFRSGHKMRYVKDKQGDLLRFGPQEPLVTKNAIIGLAGSAVSPVRYLYYITNMGISLRPVKADVTFAAYDPVRGVGLGVSNTHTTSIINNKYWSSAK